MASLASHARGCRITSPLRLARQTTIPAVSQLARHLASKAGGNCYIADGRWRIGIRTDRRRAKLTTWVNRRLDSTSTAPYLTTPALRRPPLTHSRHGLAHRRPSKRIRSGPPRRMSSSNNGAPAGSLSRSNAGVGCVRSYRPYTSTFPRKAGNSTPYSTNTSSVIALRGAHSLTRLSC
jgi:hypothetical protein